MDGIPISLWPNGTLCKGCVSTDAELDRVEQRRLVKSDKYFQWSGVKRGRVELSCVGQSGAELIRPELHWAVLRSVNSYLLKRSFVMLPVKQHTSEVYEVISLTKLKCNARPVKSYPPRRIVSLPSASCAPLGTMARLTPFGLVLGIWSGPRVHIFYLKVCSAPQCSIFCYSWREESKAYMWTDLNIKWRLEKMVFVWGSGQKLNIAANMKEPFVQLHTNIYIL